ncbi:7720_t:CDS:2 [Racocetra fulgida]|uniref:7720_t:CDS:1 n=1 Tax=Racocetra fulgida TaxID=60492 RepID=A0A9N8Z682_9GLOM|nr:7720_t:CDS:2 [Racocetra fulgida]
MANKMIKKKKYSVGHICGCWGALIFLTNIMNLNANEIVYNIK